MSSIFPLRKTVTRDESREPRLVDLDEETADEVFEALAAATTRQIFLSLHEQPQTASDLATETETSVQNVQYHLEKLQAADLVDVVDTWYSERGAEMKVYAPNDESLVLYAGRDKRGSLRSLLNRLAGAASLLIPSSILIGLAARRSSSGQEEVTLQDLGEDGEPVDVETVDMPEEGVEEAESGTGGDDIGIASEDAPGDGDVVLDAADGNGSEVVIGQNQTDTPVLITDGGDATTIPGDTVAQTSDTVLGMDPAIAVAGAFFLGGVVVLLALWAWYGWPGSDTGS